MEPSNTNHESRYWKSLREYHNDPASADAKAHEFAKGVTDEFDVNTLSPMSRKQFLGALAASAAFAAAGCNSYRDKGEIVPYNKKPEEITLGVANHYASTCTGCAEACGILVKTREGRPIKVNGNPDHPVNKGSVCAQGQASILNLYDPERLKDPMLVSSGILTKTTWKAADTKLIAAFTAAANQKKEIALITQSLTSPSLTKLLGEFAAKYPGAKHYAYELFDGGARQSAWTKSTGGTALPVIAWEKANVVLAVESDFLGYDGNLPEQTRLFASRRDVMKGKNFNRLYSADATMNSTAMNADHRLRVRPDRQLAFVLSLLNEVRPSAQTSAYSLSAFVKENGLDDAVVKQLVNDLKANAGAAIVHAGDTMPEAVHIAVNLLNAALGNDALYRRDQAKHGYAPLMDAEQWSALVARMNAGQVAAVVHVDTNPVYHLAPDLGYTDALKKVDTVVTLAELQNETTAVSSFVLPLNHTLEGWGDHQTRTGVLSLQQPVIAPLYNTRQKEAALLIWTAGNPDGYNETLYHDYVMARWEKEVYPAQKAKAGFKAFWLSALHDGVIATNDAAPALPAAKMDAVSTLKNTVVNGTVLALTKNYFVGDGRYANNGWLQEMPHPASKIAWDNYAALSPATAKSLGASEGSMVSVTAGSRSLALPVHVQPGLADDFVAVQLGYGRSVSGSVGENVGFNASALMSKSDATPYMVGSVTLTLTGETYLLASTQEHHALDDTFLKDIHKKRGIIQEGTLAQYAEDPAFLEKEHSDLTIVPRVTYDGVKWGMAIDLNKCTGCGVCTLSCNAENNIPVVGKEQLHKGREMTWIRIDRYFSGEPDAPTVSNQPMLCQHCDNAPCENVCPVVATTHSPDGLNQMAYNRCVGTKYCSNNCPFKVRRFNFFDFRDDFAGGVQYEEPLPLMHNPEVTVRSRGVMEKCTFCVQRIMEGRQHAIEKGEEFTGAGVTVACQEACPAEAIVFGNVNDTTSKIHQYRKHSIGYRVLEEINVGPNVTYIAKLRNTDPV